MTELLLVGASGLAREVLILLRNHPEYAPIGILDDLPGQRGTTVGGVSVLGSLDEVTRHPAARVLICVGRGEARARIADRLLALGVTEDRYVSLVHQSVEVPEGCRIGSGSIVLAGVVLTADVILGRHTVVMPQVTLTHGDRVDDFVTLCAGVTLGGDVSIGSGAYLGMNAAVRERVRIGPGAVLGMGSAVLENVPDRETWVGVPARRLRAAAGDPLPPEAAAVPPTTVPPTTVPPTTVPPAARPTLPALVVPVLRAPWPTGGIE
ncbi:NeuD/PglB/VioB family sugar acetyltransferase [Cryobacterium serini]|uniref:Acetyltransferase n=1 Tax=Cryobacterium serini TaxID=1259201 RepID=A0A4R9BUW2_9MICO|nr:acetyltransferase [Cryobacterium serini]